MRIDDYLTYIVKRYNPKDKKVFILHIHYYLLNEKKRKYERENTLLLIPPYAFYKLIRHFTEKLISYEIENKTHELHLYYQQNFKQENLDNIYDLVCSCKYID